MKKFKKIFAGVIALAMVLGMVGMMPVRTAKANGDTAVTVTFNYSLQQATITSTTTPSYLYVGLIKKTEDKEPKSWDVFKFKNGMTIDLSAYAKKGVILEFKTDTDVTVERKEFAGNNAVKVKPKYVPNGKPTATTDSLEYFTFNTEVTDTIKEKLEFRLSTSDEWTDYSTVNNSSSVKEVIDQASFYGATIYFRVKGDDTDTDNKFLFASTESKVKIAKSGNAPKVKVDYSKLTVTIPKGVMLLNNPSFVPKATETTTISLKADDFIENGCDLTTGFTIYVQTEATDRKPASKIGYVKIETQAGILDENALNPNPSESKIEFTNASTNVIEYVLASGTDAATALDSVDIEAKTTKFKKIAAGGKVTFKAADVGKYLVIRVPAVTDKTTKITTPASELFTDETFRVVLKAAPDDEDETPTDTTAPVLSAGSAEDLATTNGTTATLKFTSDEAGTYYYILVKSSVSGYITKDDVINKTIDGEEDSNENITANGSSIATIGVNEISLTDLTKGGNRIACIVVKDSHGNISNILKIDFTPTDL